MKTHVLMVAKSFLATHPRAGEETNFASMILGKEKLHTIRGNYDNWKPKIDEINAGKAVLSLREWTGKPYRSKQNTIIELTDIGYQKIRMDKVGNFYVEEKPIFDVEELALNDGLVVEDFLSWFGVQKMIKKGEVFEGIVIHFTNFRYYTEKGDL